MSDASIVGIMERLKRNIGMMCYPMTLVDNKQLAACIGKDLSIVLISRFAEIMQIASPVNQHILELFLGTVLNSKSLINNH